MGNFDREKHLQMCLDQLEARVLSARDTEDMLFSFMFSYFSELGYEFAHEPASTDSWIDFVGTSSKSPQAMKIGIVYKHHDGVIKREYVDSLVRRNLGSTVDRIIIVSNARFSMADVRRYRKNLPADVELVGISQLRSWSYREKALKEFDPTIIDSLRRNLSDELVRLIAENPRYLEEVEWRELERVVQAVFEQLGFDSKLTPGEKDGGKDVILRCKVGDAQHTYYVELKHWRSKQKVGGVAARQFLNIIVNEDISGGLFLSTYGFSDNAFEMLTQIERKLLRFGQEEKIVSLCKQYVLSKSALWEPLNILDDVLYSRTV